MEMRLPFPVGFLAGVVSRKLEREDLSPRPPLLQGPSTQVEQIDLAAISFRGYIVRRVPRNVR